jgi:hypothetical protein
MITGLASPRRPARARWGDVFPSLAQAERKASMNCSRIAARFSFSLLAVLALALPAAAGQQVPFHGNLQGTVERGPVEGAPPHVLVLVEAEGQATHLGDFTVSVPHQVDLATKTAHGTYTFTAANGDTLTADFEGASMPSPTTPGVLLIVEKATITGGTGRFAGASGGFIVERSYDTVAGTTTGSFEGTVSSPGTKKQ